MRGRGRVTDVSGWEAAGPNKRKCLFCEGEFSVYTPEGAVTGKSKWCR